MAKLQMGGIYKQWGLRSRLAKLRIVLVLVVVIVFLSHGNYNLVVPTSLGSSAQDSNVQDTNQTNHLSTWSTSPELVDFWHRLSEALVESQLKCDKISPDRAVNESEFDYNVKTDIRPDLIHMSDEDFNEMQSKHDLFVSKLGILKSKLPYWKGTEGIVTTAGGRYMGIFITSLLMLRRSGSTLPVHVLISSPNDDPHNHCNGILNILGATCLPLNEIWETAPALADIKPVTYQFKALAILLSPFERVLFLDADCFPGYNPDHLLASEPFVQRGLVTWPDFWYLTASSLFYKITRTPAPSRIERLTSESSILMYDKTKHADTLILANYYNFYGPDYYYPLLSQGAPGQGDKETFLQAALVINRPFYDIRTPPLVMGRWINGTLRSAGFSQVHPVDDWEKFGKLGKVWAASDREDAKTRPFFIHNNMVKLDITNPFPEGSEALLRGERGELVRLWGPKEDLVHNWGYDIEKVLWEEMVKTGCQMASIDNCISIKMYWDLAAGEDAASEGEDAASKSEDVVMVEER